MEISYGKISRDKNISEIFLDWVTVEREASPKNISEIFLGTVGD